MGRIGVARTPHVAIVRHEHTRRTVGRPPGVLEVPHRTHVTTQTLCVAGNACGHAAVVDVIQWRARARARVVTSTADSPRQNMESCCIKSVLGRTRKP